MSLPYGSYDVEPTQTEHTNFIDRFGLNAKDTENPTGVAGVKIDGYFRDDSQTIKQPGNFYGNRKFHHDSQLVLRFPDDWNGKLFVTGLPGVRGQTVRQPLHDGRFFLKERRRPGGR